MPKQIRIDYVQIASFGITYWSELSQDYDKTRLIVHEMAGALLAGKRIVTNQIVIDVGM